jgi:hypothetical protein
MDSTIQECVVEALVTEEWEEEGVWEEAVSLVWDTAANPNIKSKHFIV